MDCVMLGTVCEYVWGGRGVGGISFDMRIVFLQA
jgi:hypothetical protein